MLKAREVLSSTLTKAQERLVYHLSDGRASQEVGDAAGVSHVTVISHWKRWATIGIVEPLRVRGGTRYRRIFSLEDFGIEVPAAQVESSEKME